MSENSFSEALNDVVIEIKGNRKVKELGIGELLHQDVLDGMSKAAFEYFGIEPMNISVDDEEDE